MNLQEVKTKTARALADVIGQYQSEGSKRVNALSVTPPRTPAGVRCIGLEAVIDRHPQEETTQRLSESLLSKSYWVITLIQWDETGSTIPAKNRLRREFDVIRSQTTSATDISREKTVVRIYDPQWVE